MLEVGQTLTIIPLDNEKEKYRSKIIDMSRDYLYISYPANEKTNRTIFLPLYTEFIFVFITREGEVYEFTSEVIGRVMKSLPLLQVKRPAAEDLRRIQRRQFIRVQRTLDVAIHPMKKEFPPFHTITYDISAGGVAFIAPKKISLDVDQKIKVWLVLPWENGTYDYLHMHANIVRITEHNEDNRLVSAKFIDLPLREEQLLLRFCFETQLIFHREKGLRE